MGGAMVFYRVNPSLSQNGYFGFMRRQPFQKNPHILRVCSGFFEKLSLPKAKISHFEIGSPFTRRNALVLLTFLLMGCKLPIEAGHYEGIWVKKKEDPEVHEPVSIELYRRADKSIFLVATNSSGTERFFCRHSI
jgi:hypothetical protein